MSMLANNFTDWLNLRAAEAGLDISQPDTQPTFAIVAAMAQTGTLATAQVAYIAAALNTTPEEVIAASKS